MQVPPELLGFRGDPKWRDMSDHLVHFTKNESLLGILREGHVEARNQFGWGIRSDAANAARRMSACFSEVPVDLIERLAARRGHYGIGFTREFIMANGGGRVWYAEGPQRALVFNAYQSIWRTDPIRQNPFWKLVPFIDDVNPGYNFTWEREWRVPGGLRFSLADVQFLVLPRGADKVIFENPAPGVPLLTADAVDFWDEAFSSLGGPEDRYVDEFLRVFCDPINHLSWDSEDQDYFWIVSEYSTDSAVDWLFDDLDDDAVERLVARLDDISMHWIRLQELEDALE